MARLITEGLTNAEIATELSIAPKTASSHVEHILAKLGASRRAEIAAWATAVVPADPLGERDASSYSRRRHLPEGRPMPTDTAVFTGFRPEAIQFLADLTENNSRDWFQPRKGEYERLLKEPLAALCVALDEAFRARGIRLEADPTRSPFRIYRDVRFSKDKSPYKTNIAASFPWAEGGGADGPHGFGESGNPGGYFHLSPGEVYIGGGMWRPPTAKLAAFRAAVADDPKAVRRLIDEPGFVSTFGPISGDKLKRVPSGFPSDHPEAELLKQKDLTFGRRLADDDVMGPQLVDLLADSFLVAVPVMRWLARL